MFNFFESIKNEFNLKTHVNTFNMINMSNRTLYVEGHRGVILISNENISFRVKKGIVVVLGEKLSIKKITNSTLVIDGFIKKLESY